MTTKETIPERLARWDVWQNDAVNGGDHASHYLVRVPVQAYNLAAASSEILAALKETVALAKELQRKLDNAIPFIGYLPSDPDRLKKPMLDALDKANALLGEEK